MRNKEIVFSGKKRHFGVEKIDFIENSVLVKLLVVEVFEKQV